MFSCIWFIFGFLTLLSLSFSLISSHIGFYFILLFKYLCFELKKKLMRLGVLHFLISLWLSFIYYTMCKPFLFCVKKCIFYGAIFGTPNNFSSLFYGRQGEDKSLEMLEISFNMIGVLSCPINSVHRGHSCRYLIGTIMHHFVTKIIAFIALTCNFEKRAHSHWVWILYIFFFYLNSLICV